MQKQEFYLKALKSGLYKKKAFIISAFSLIREDFSQWKKDPYPYRIVQTQTGYFFVDPENKEKLIPIEGSVIGEPLFKFKEPIDLKTGELPNLKKDITSTIGNVFFNYCSIVNSFGDKIDYLEGKVNIRAIEDLIATRLQDTPDESFVRNNKDIYVDEYIKFVDSTLFLTNFTQLCVWAATEKVMTPPPGIVEFKQALLDKYKDRLHDPVVVAAIDAELVKFDAEYLKGDPGENFLTSSKLRNIVRKKLFLMHGAEVSLNDGVNVDLIENSLSQGWDINKFPAMNNSLRAGSYNRGKETQLGGESVKWLLRASSNIMVPVDDCGTRIGKLFKVDKNTVSKLIGFSIVTENGYKTIDSETDTGTYLGKTLMVRSPMYCKLDKTDYCKICVGVKLSNNPTGLSLAVSEYGSNFMSIFMAAGHSKGLMLAKMNYKEALT